MLAPERTSATWLEDGNIRVFSYGAGIGRWFYEYDDQSAGYEAVDNSSSVQVYMLNDDSVGTLTEVTATASRITHTATSSEGFVFTNTTSLIGALPSTPSAFMIADEITIRNGASTPLPLTFHSRNSFELGVHGLGSSYQEVVALFEPGLAIGVHNDTFLVAATMASDQAISQAYRAGPALWNPLEFYANMNNTIVQGDQATHPTGTGSFGIGFDFGTLQPGEEVQISARYLIGAGNTEIPFDFPLGVPLPAGLPLLGIGLAVMVPRVRGAGRNRALIRPFGAALGLLIAVSASLPATAGTLWANDGTVSLGLSGDGFHNVSYDFGSGFENFDNSSVVQKYVVNDLLLGRANMVEQSRGSDWITHDWAISGTNSAADGFTFSITQRLAGGLASRPSARLLEDTITVRNDNATAETLTLHTKQGYEFFVHGRGDDSHAVAMRTVPGFALAAYNDTLIGGVSVATPHAATFAWEAGRAQWNNFDTFANLDNAIFPGTTFPFTDTIAMGFDFGLLQPGEEVTMSARYFFDTGANEIQFDFPIGVPTPASAGLLFLGATAAAAAFRRQTM